MFEYEAICDSCQLRVFFDVRADEPLPDADLRARIVATLGDDGMLVCPRCDSWIFIHVGDRPIADAQRLQRAEAARRIGRSAKGIRFGVGDPNGARSSVFRVWMNDRRDDVYIAARGLASELKVSLHPSFWYYGFTKLHTQRDRSIVPKDADRKLRVWDRPNELGPGWTRAFSIMIPGSEINAPPVRYRGSESVWYPVPQRHEAAHFTVVLSKSNATRGRRGYPSANGYALTTEAVTRLAMTTGEQFWVLFHVAPMSDDQVAHLERARATMKKVIGDVLEQRATDDPEFSPRALVFGESDDGTRHFIDLSLLTPDRGFRGEKTP